MQRDQNKAVRDGVCADNDDAKAKWFEEHVNSADFIAVMKARYKSFINSIDRMRGATGKADNTFTTWKGNICKLTMYSAVVMLEFLRKYKKLECKGQAQKMVEYAKASLSGDANAKVRKHIQFQTVNTV